MRVQLLKHQNTESGFSVLFIGKKHETEDLKKTKWFQDRAKDAAESDLKTVIMVVDRLPNQPDLPAIVDVIEDQMTNLHLDHNLEIEEDD